MLSHHLFVYYNNLNFLKISFFFFFVVMVLQLCVHFFFCFLQIEKSLKEAKRTKDYFEKIKFGGLDYIHYESDLIMTVYIEPDMVTPVVRVLNQYLVDYFRDQIPQQPFGGLVP